MKESWLILAMTLFAVYACKIN